MKLSVVLAVRNEMPTLLGTLYSFYEDLSTWLEPREFEFVVIDNCGTDSTAAILRDKLRRWVKAGLLQVHQFDDRPANVLARNVGAEAARGEVLIHADGHLSVAAGTTHALHEGAAQGGVWHPSFQAWGDTSDIRCYGYDLKLREKFWGNISRGIPKPIGRLADGRPDGAYPVPMASHCCLAVRRDEFLALGGYGRQLRVYGGGEPLLDLKWWMCGSRVMIEPRAFVRHAFGVSATWRSVPKDRTCDTFVRVRRGGSRDSVELSKDLKAGDSYLKYARDYAWTNEDLHHNFMAAAYIVGEYGWLQRIYKVFWDKRWGFDSEGKPLPEPANRNWLKELNKLRREVLSGCAEERAFVKSRQTRSLDDLLAHPPWPV